MFCLNPYFTFFSSERRGLVFRVLEVRFVNKVISRLCLQIVLCPWNVVNSRKENASALTARSDALRRMAFLGCLQRNVCKRLGLWNERNFKSEKPIRKRRD